MKALSIKQPYAWLVLQPSSKFTPRQPLKPVENRTWGLPATFKVPQRIYIHASLTLYDVTLQEIRDKLSPNQWLQQKEALHSIYNLWETYKSRREELKKFRYFGHILGEVDIIGEMFKTEDGFVGKRFLTEAQYLEYRDSYWFFGPIGFVLDNPVLYDKPIPFQDKLGLFEPEGKQ
jgi:hypothetical protein